MGGHTFTQEERERGKTSRHKTVKAPLLSYFEDDAHWVDLARARGVNLHQHDTPCTKAGMERWFKKLGWSATRYFKWVGGGKLSDFIEMAPGWGMRAFVGLLLEEPEKEG